MTDPVTLKAAEKVKEGVEKGADGIMGFFKGLFSGPVNGVVGVGKGIFSNTIGNLFGVLTTSGMIAAAARFMPDLVTWIPLKVNGEKVGETLAKDAQTGGDGAIIKDALLAGVVVNASIGAVKQGLGGAMSGTDDKKGFAEKTGGVIGTLATLGALGYLGYKAIEHNKIGLAGDGDNATAKIPDLTPKAPDAAKTKAIV